ncbi:MAG: hypothetical protein HQL35_09115 [Alphaproteobacteria bacterium]|nr:hypothetical protein [Alphaproteobacteria bacterium]
MLNDDEMTEAEIRQAEAETVARAAARGNAPSVDPDVADDMGAFQENALDAEAAEESRFDDEPDAMTVILEDGQ